VVKLNNSLDMATVKGAMQSFVDEESQVKAVYDW